MTQERILLVEDDPEIRRLITRFLVSQRFDVHEAASVSSALAKLDACGPLDLAIVDFWLNGRPAIDVIDGIRKNLPGVPIIVVSGGGRQMDLEKTQAFADISGAVIFVQKPFTKADLLTAVAEALQSD